MTTDPPEHERRFVSAESIATMLSLEVDDVVQMLTSGELRGIQIGPASVWRVETAELESFIEAKYEEARRHALWQGHDLASIVDLDPPPRGVNKS